MKIAILGAGKIGSTFAFQLAKVGGHEVTAIARPSSVRMRQLQRDNGIINKAGELASVRVLDTLVEKTPYDLLIVTLLDHQAVAILPTLQRSAAKSILFMFNTFYPERLQDAVGHERCAFGMPFVQATLERDGRLKVRIGAGGQKTLMGEHRWVELFDAAGLPSTIEPNMPLWLRCHVPMCVAFESISVAGERRGGGASWGEAIVLARGVRSCFNLIKELGHDIYPKGKRRIDAAPTSVLASILWFLSRIRGFREVLATGKSECQVLVDDMVAAAPGERAHVTTSAIQAMKPI